MVQEVPCDLQCGPAPGGLAINAMMTAADQSKDGLSFGPFHLVASERLLTKEGAPVDLGGRALDILMALISTPNEVVSKKDLMSRVWPDVTVEEGSLRFHMAGLRKAMAGVVSAGGTAASANIKGVVLAGKTGTSQNTERP